MRKFHLPKISKFQVAKIILFSTAVSLALTAIEVGLSWALIR